MGNCSVGRSVVVVPPWRSTRPCYGLGEIDRSIPKENVGNKLALRRKLYSLRLKDGESIQKHIKEMTIIFDEMTII